MKQKLTTVLLLLAVFMTLSFNSHPIKLTSSMIKYEKKSSSFNMECKVFIDDFAPAINAGLEKKINDKSLSKNDLKDIESYFNSNYKIYINNERLGLTVTNHKVKDNVMTISFSITYKELKKGDNLKIENELLFEKFPDIQSNWVTLMIPPFIKNSNFESNFEDYSYSKTL